jgi:SOS-response transcriptional repressor LexA
MQKFCNNLRMLRLRLGLTQEQLADKLGFSTSSIAHWETIPKLPSPKKLRMLADKLGCTIPYLIGDEIQNTLPDPHQSPAIPTGKVTTQRVFQEIPVVSWARAGVASDYADLCNQIDETIPSECKDPNAFALIIEGDSMEPKFEAGYRVIFSPNNEPRNGDFVVARLKEGHGVLFKRFKRTGNEGKLVRLESLNPAYTVLEFPLHGFHFIYPAVEFRCKLYR